MHKRDSIDEKFLKANFRTKVYYVGNLVAFLGVAMGTGLASIGLVPVSQFSARTSSCGQGRIIPKGPRS